MAKPARNGPCPCGSGRKYKGCCLPEIERRDALWRTANRVCEQAWQSIVAFGVAELADGNPDELLAVAWRDFSGEEPGATADNHSLQALVPWMTYHWFPTEEDATLAELYLDDHADDTPPDVLEWIDTSRESVFSIFEVVDVTRGESMRVRDLLQGGELVVHERSGSEAVPVRAILFARPVVFRGLATFDGMHPRPLPPQAGDALVEALRRHLKRKPPLDRDTVRELDVELFALYSALVLQDDLPKPLPTITNTDGDLLVMCELRWSFPAKRRKELEARLDALPMLERDDEGWTWWKPDNAMHASWTNTTLGRLRIEKATLVGEVNSEARATALRELVDGCGEALLRFVGIEQTTQEEMRAEIAARSNAAAEREPEPPPDPELLATFLASHYGAWPDQPLPALRGKTPRQAIRTAKGRRDVDALLRDMEFRTSTTDMAGLYDFGELRRTLGL